MDVGRIYSIQQKTPYPDSKSVAGALLQVWNECEQENFAQIARIRQAFADYFASEGCSCCRNESRHEYAEKQLAELLGAEPYDDGSGVNWYKYRTENK